jgi:hypothetical protein
VVNGAIVARELQIVADDRLGDRWAMVPIANRARIAS